MERVLPDRHFRARIYGRPVEEPQLNPATCSRCGDCVRVCPARVLELHQGLPEVVYGAACVGCGHCGAVCPTGSVQHVPSAAEPIGRRGSQPLWSAESLLRLLRERRSVRLFSDQPVDRAQLESIVTAGRYAPTGSNLQDVSYTVLDSVDKVSELRHQVVRFMKRTFRLMGNPLLARLFALKVGRTNLRMMQDYANSLDFVMRSGGDGPFFPLPRGTALVAVHCPSFDSMGSFNGAVALYNGALMAHCLGLGSCFLGFVAVSANMDRRVRRTLGLQPGQRCHGAMVLGHPDVRFRRLVQRRAPAVDWR